MAELGIEPLELRLPPDPRSVRAARHGLDVLADTVPGDVLDDARLLASELVTNAVRHGQLSAEQAIVLRAQTVDGMLRVQVRDDGVGFQLEPRRSDAADDSGWGLYLVGQIAARWGMSSAKATTVWFELPLARGADGNGDQVSA